MARNAYLTQLNKVQELKLSLPLWRRPRLVIGAASTQLNEINRQRINFESELVNLKKPLVTVRSWPR